MLEAYAEWYKGFTSGEIDSGSSPLVALAMASRDNRKFMEPVRDWYRRYFDRVKQEACGSERALVSPSGVSGFLCLGRLFQGQPNEAALCI